MNPTIQFQVGRLLCGNVRDMLGIEAIYRPSLRWHESAGWIVRTFTISGDKQDVEAVGSRLQAYMNALKHVG